MNEKQVFAYANKNEFEKPEFCADIHLYNIPDNLLRRFLVQVAYKYRGNLSEAVQALMKKAIDVTALEIPC